ncbi:MULTISPECIES: DUF4232 domain-containing protein [unclassified Cryobacterium]|uniref:DUF4232 domain-containing protein n=1 Tax=unclassified Cryobacterium TaxID=2649013 RepID=UPI001068D800|nr:MULTISPECIES: DUF4232 domain-containing protein [unclassified Cryobacterium]TFB93728.1 DUF4232 domain-containing protein [Cryobacterium sp. MDB2-A-1]TFC14840.1 DUF4232 domain-containing protein [Cryobacterium sp. MDB2-A-2]
MTGSRVEGARPGTSRGTGRRMAAALGAAALLCTTLSACGTAAPSPTASATASASASTSASTSAVPTATGAPTGTPTGSPTAVPTPTPGDDVPAACSAGALGATLASRPMDSGMSSFYWDLTLTNTGSQACTVQGYPGVRLVNAVTGALLGPAAAHERYPTVTEAAVELAPGASAYSLLHLNQAGAYTCTLVAVTELDVTPPGTDVPRWVTTPNPIQGCDDPLIGLVKVGPFAPASLVY